MPSYYWVVDTAPTLDAITRDQVKTHLGIAKGDTTYNDQLDLLINAAQREFERETSIHLLTQTNDFTTNDFPANGAPICIPAYPLQSVTSITYQDADSAEQTLSSTKYIAQATEPIQVGLVYDESDWPETADEPDSVVIKLVTGYTSAANVPADIRQCLLMLVESRFMGRHADDTLEMAIITLISKYALGDGFIDYAY